MIGLLNGFKHLIWMIEFASYVPGVIFGIFLDAPFIFYISCSMLKEKLYHINIIFLFFDVYFHKINIIIHSYDFL